MPGDRHAGPVHCGERRHNGGPLQVEVSQREIRKIDPHIPHVGLLAGALQEAQGGTRVEVHALEFQATSRANIPSLQRLVAIQRRLIQESGIALMGGEKKLDKLAARATKELRSKYPERAGFTTAELVGVGRRKADGARVVHFRREESATVLSYVIVIVPKTGEPTAQLLEK